MVTKLDGKTQHITHRPLQVASPLCIHTYDQHL